MTRILNLYRKILCVELDGVRPNHLSVSISLGRGVFAFFFRFFEQKREEESVGG